MSLKYTDKDGKQHVLNSNTYKINNVIVSQEKGQSTTDVMSQKAVTDELGNCVKFEEYNENSVTINSGEKNFVIDCGTY